jgi:hypothetical protein
MLCYEIPVMLCEVWDSCYVVVCNVGLILRRTQTVKDLVVSMTEDNCECSKRF